MEDRIKGGLFGIAIGDALGAPIENLSSSWIKLRYGKVESYKSGIIGIPYFLRFSGTVTDDTALSLAVLKGILKNPDTPYKDIGEGFRRYKNTIPIYIGKNLLVTFLSYRGDWLRASEVADKVLKGRTAGNGALMRSLPVALCYEDYGKMLEITKLQAEMTHFSSISTDACLAYNKIAYSILNHGAGLKEAIQDEIRGTKYEVIFEKPTHEPSGFSDASLQWALYWLFHTNSFEEAVVSAVNQGGDADTIGSLVGGLAGLYYGYSSIPDRFIIGLWKRRKLEKLATEILQVRAINS